MYFRSLVDAFLNSPFNLYHGTCWFCFACNLNLSIDSCLNFFSFHLRISIPHRCCVQFLLCSSIAATPIFTVILAYESPIQFHFLGMTSLPGIFFQVWFPCLLSFSGMASLSGVVFHMWHPVHCHSQMCYRYLVHVAIIKYVMSRAKYLTSLAS